MSSLLQHAPGVHIFLILVVAGLFTSGCRSYGGHGAEEATYRQAQVAHQVFEEELVRARANLNKVQSAASNDEALSLLAVQYAQIVQGHEAILDHQANLIADLEGDSDYRRLHRTYAAMISQQRTIRTQYEGVLEHFRRTAAQQDTVQRVQRPYALIPPYYNRISGQQREVSVSRVISQVRSGGTPSSGEGILSPAVEEEGAAGNFESDAGASNAEAAPDAESENAIPEPDDQ